MFILSEAESAIDEHYKSLRFVIVTPHLPAKCPGSSATNATTTTRDQQDVFPALHGMTAYGLSVTRAEKQWLTEVYWIDLKCNVAEHGGVGDCLRCTAKSRREKTTEDQRPGIEE